MAAKRVGDYHSAFTYLLPKSGAKGRSAPALPPVTLMLLGKTGSGKSSLGNAILSLRGDDSFTVTDCLYSTPEYCAVSKEAEVHGRQVKVVDTPGLMDTSAGGEKKALEGICDGISHCYEGVDAFLIVLRLDVRLTDEEWRTVDKLEELFGEQFWSHTIVVFTYGDEIKNDYKTFQSTIEATKARLPQLESLLSKLRTQPVLVDASTKRQKSVVAKQSLHLLHTIDMLVTSDSKKKYTNDIFAAVKASLLTKAKEDLEKQLLAARVENEKLKEKNAQLETVQVKDQNAIEELQDTVAQVLHSVDCERRDAVERGTAEVKKKWCSIL